MGDLLQPQKVQLNTRKKLKIKIRTSQILNTGAKKGNKNILKI